MYLPQKYFELETHYTIIITSLQVESRTLHVNKPTKLLVVSKQIYEPIKIGNKQILIRFSLLPFPLSLINIQHNILSCLEQDEVSVAFTICSSNKINFPLNNIYTNNKFRQL